MATRLVNKFYKADAFSHNDATPYSRYTNENIHSRDNFIDECLIDEELVPMIHDNNNNQITNKDVYVFLKLMYKILNVFENDIKDDADAMDAYLDYCIETLHLCEITLQYLTAANRNYHLLLSTEYRTVGEDLLDMAFEENVCAICLYDNVSRAGLKAFYYSTSFGLNMPVCHECAISGANAEEDKKDEDYVQEESDKEESDLEESDKEDNDQDYIPSDEDEEEDEDAEEDEGVDEVVEDDDDLEISNIIPTNDSWLPSDTNESSISSNYATGWYNGWFEAMRFIEEQAHRNSRAPALPPCDNCDTTDCKTKKCGGSCNGAVRYCSTACQSAHWKEEHKYVCSKM